MPIRPENRARYPADWPAISSRIRFERAGGRCECTGQCGIDHHDETELIEPTDLSPPLDRCPCRHDDRNPITGAIVVLTVMHLDHTPENVDDDNLLAGCQRCHNRYDAPRRRAGISQRRHAARAIGDLFEGQAID